MKRQLSSKYLGEVLFITDIDKQIKEDRIARQLGKLVIFYLNKQAHWEALDKEASEKLQKNWNSTNTQRAIQAAIKRTRNDYEKQEIVYRYVDTMDKIDRFLKRYGEEYSAWAIHGRIISAEIQTATSTQTKGTL